MQRATKDAWLQGPGDLREADVEDVPVPGQSVRVRALSARYASEVQTKATKLVLEGRERIAKVDIGTMEMLQFVHGVIDPVFNESEAKQIQSKYGPAFQKVIAKIDEISAINKEAIEETETRFPAGGASSEGSHLGDGAPNGSAGSDLHVRAGA
jgi:hypothetical protein